MADRLHSYPSGDTSVPYLEVENFFPCADDLLFAPSRPDISKPPKPPINATWSNAGQGTSLAGPSATNHHHASNLATKTYSGVIDLTISPVLEPTYPSATDENLEEDEWNISTQMSPEPQTISSPSLPGPPMYMPPLVSDAAGVSSTNACMQRCTSRIANVLNDLASDLALLSKEERELFDVESLVDHTTRAMRSQFSETPHPSG